MWMLVRLISGQTPGVLKVLLHGGETRQRHIIAVTGGLWGRTMFLHYALLCIPCWDCGLWREGCWLRARMAAFGKGRVMTSWSGLKENNFSAPPSECNWAVMERSQTVLPRPGGQKAKACPGQMELQRCKRYCLGGKKGFQSNLALSNLTTFLTTCRFPVLSLKQEDSRPLQEKVSRIFFCIASPLYFP